LVLEEDASEELDDALRAEQREEFPERKVEERQLFDGAGPLNDEERLRAHRRQSRRKAREPQRAARKRDAYFEQQVEHETLRTQAFRVGRTRHHVPDTFKMHSLTSSLF